MIRAREISVCEAVAFYAAAPLRKRQASAAIIQAARSERIGFFDRDWGDLVAVAMLYPRTDEVDVYELPFACRPDAARHLVGIVRTARLMQRRLGHIDNLTIRATVRVGHQPGRRLAKLCGFKPARVRRGFVHWEWRP